MAAHRPRARYTLAEAAEVITADNDSESEVESDDDFFDDHKQCNDELHEHDKVEQIAQAYLEQQGRE